MKKHIIGFMALVLSQSALAAGLRIVTECKTVDSRSLNQVAITLDRQVDYQTRHGEIKVSMEATVQYDANPFRFVESFSTPASVDNSPVPQLTREYTANADSNTLSVSSFRDTSDKDTPLNESRLKLTVLAKKAFLGADTYAVFKMASHPNMNGSALAVLYFVDAKGRQIGTPDRGPTISMQCQTTTHDI